MNDNTDYPQILEVIEDVPLTKTERREETISSSRYCYRLAE
jgi:hypothetical protein